jgi:hypothetical protein
MSSQLHDSEALLMQADASSHGLSHESHDSFLLVMYAYTPYNRLATKAIGILLAKVFKKEKSLNFFVDK